MQQEAELRLDCKETDSSASVAGIRFYQLRITLEFGSREPEIMVGDQIWSFVVGETRNFGVLGKTMTPTAV